MNGSARIPPNGIGGGSSQSRRDRVLVVDDSRDVRDALAGTLESAGYDVTAVGSAREALEALSEVQPALVITDLHMPTMDGFKLRDEIQRSGAGDIPVIALTGHGVLRQDAVRGGFAAALQKPCDVSMLLSLVAHHCRRREPARS